MTSVWPEGIPNGRARDWVSANLNFDHKAKLSLFETTIRIVGGLLSAYDLSEDSVFLQKAQLLVDKLMPVFNLTGYHITLNPTFLNNP